MNLTLLYHRYRFRLRAERDANRSIDACEDRILEVIGPRPTWDVEGNLEHRRIAAELNTRAEMEERREEVHDREEETIRLIHPKLLLAGVIVCAGLECVGSAMILKSLGVPNPARVAFALMLAAGLIVMTSLVVRLGRVRVTEE